MNAPERISSMTQWVQVGRMEDIPPLGARVVKSAHGDIAVFRNADDEVFALADKCPHKGGALSEGMVCGKVVHCPLHDWKIDLHSGKVKEPDDGCVTTFEVEVDPSNGSIYLSV